MQGPRGHEGVCAPALPGPLSSPGSPAGGGETGWGWADPPQQRPLWTSQTPAGSAADLDAMGVGGRWRVWGRGVMGEGEPSLHRPNLARIGC